MQYQVVTIYFEMILKCKIAQLVGDLVSFRGPFFVKSNLECLTCSLYVSKPKKLGLKIRATVFGRFWANFRAKNKNTNF